VLKIRVKGYLTLGKAMGGTPELDIEMEHPTPRSVLEELSGRFGKPWRDLVFDPQSGHISSRIRVLVNGRHCASLPQRLDTALKDGDELALFPPVAGG
jgi:MoaD family protein